MVITPTLAKDAERMTSNECMKQADVYSEHGALRYVQRDIWFVTVRVSFTDEPKTFSETLTFSRTLSRPL